MPTQPMPLQPLAVAPEFSAAELEGAPTLTLRGGEARVLGDAALPDAAFGSATERAGGLTGVPPSHTLTF